MKQDKMKYSVRRVDEQQDNEKLPAMPMLEISMSAAMLAFFILICAAAFGVFLIKRMSGAEAGTIVGCLLMLAVIVGAVAGIFKTTMDKFAKSGSKIKFAFAFVLYIAAVVIGIAVGMQWTGI